MTDINASAPWRPTFWRVKITPFAAVRIAVDDGDDHVALEVLLKEGLNKKDCGRG